MTTSQDQLETQGSIASKKHVDIQDRTFEFACRILGLYKTLAKQGEEFRVIGRQLLRSGTSIGANLEEASAGQSKADFIAKCSISLKEARETNYWLRLLQRTDVVNKEMIASLLDESRQIVAILTTIVKNAALSSKRG